MRLPVTELRFHGHPLVAVRDGMIIRVAMKPICEALGLDWSAQYRRLLRHPILAEGVAMMAIPSLGGGQDTLTLHLHLLHGWLFGIDSNRVREEIRPLLLTYQRECFAVLDRHFRRERHLKITRLSLPQLISAHKHLRQLLAALRLEADPAERRLLLEMVEQTCQLMGLTPPELTEAGAATVPGLLPGQEG